MPMMSLNWKKSLKSWSNKSLHEQKRPPQSGFFMAKQNAVQPQN